MNLANLAIAPFLVLFAFPVQTQEPTARPQPPYEWRVSNSPGSHRIVTIQPLGVVHRSEVEAVADRLERTFEVEVVVLDVKPLPESALYLPRMRFRGDQLVEWLGAEKSTGSLATLGLMSRDLSATKGRVYDWGVMGVASPWLQAGVISTYRLAGHDAPESLVTRRLCQVAVHELGHALGLPHCPVARCIMNDAEGGIGAVDRSSGRFCPSCRARLGGLLRDS